jgi:hypothetical protein
MAKRTFPKRTELNHKLLWYVENYGLHLSTVRRHRSLLDHPLALQVQLLFSPGPMADLRKFCAYMRANPPAVDTVASS